MFWILAAFLVLVFLMGGSSRATVLSLPVLRPLSAMVLALGIAFARHEDVRAHRPLIALMLVVTVAVVVQLIPLPPALWHALPHRELAIMATQEAGLSNEWRPFTLSPTGTRNAAYSLLVPASMLALALCVGPADRRRLISVFLGLGVVALVLGALQIASSPNMAFYLYRLSSPFLPTGFFANPNHHAAFMAVLLPMAAYAASSLHGRIGPVSKEVVANTAVVLVVALTILLAGSRAGLVLLALGIAAMPLARQRSRSTALRTHSRIILAGMAAGLAGIVAIAIALGRAAAIQRVAAGDALGDLRLQVWPIILRETIAYFPVGAGWGSFVETFQIAEPYELLKPTYLNHAHNDWLEVVMGGGLIGLILLAAVLGFWLRAVMRMIRIDKSRAGLGWVGLSVLMVLGLSSLVDYPLRTPCLQATFILAWLWVGDALNAKSTGVPKPELLAATSSNTGFQ